MLLQSPNGHKAGLSRCVKLNSTVSNGRHWSRFAIVCFSLNNLLQMNLDILETVKNSKGGSFHNIQQLSDYSSRVIC